MARDQHEGATLRLRQVRVSYGEFRAVHGVDLEVAPGEIVSIIGANGAGKSSLLKAVVGQADRVEGELHFGTLDLARCATPEIVAQGIALVPEGRRLFPTLTVEENLGIGQAVGRAGDIGFEDVYRYFPILRERRRQQVRELSGGQQQMVALGRALLANPRLLLCDEISLGLAPLVVQALYLILPQVRDRGIGIVVVEQDIGRSLAIADRFYCLLEGRVSLQGRPADHSRESVMKHYFGT